MPLIAMTREMGSLGKDVAKGVADALGIPIMHHEIIEPLVYSVDEVRAMPRHHPQEVGVEHDEGRAQAPHRHVA